jgi:hypothetical protein
MSRDAANRRAIKGRFRNIAALSWEGSEENASRIEMGLAAAAVKLAVFSLFRSYK